MPKINTAGLQLIKNFEGLRLDAYQVNAGDPWTDRFWSKVQRGAPDACWLWTAGRSDFGHGRFRMGARGSPERRAHVLAWELTHGPVPEGLCVLHDCPGGDNPACCNLAHLWLGTKKDNTHDAMRKGRLKKPPRFVGDDHPLRRDPSKAARGNRNGNSREARERRMRSCPR